MGFLKNLCSISFSLLCSSCVLIDMGSPAAPGEAAAPEKNAPAPAEAAAGKEALDAPQLKALAPGGAKAQAAVAASSAEAEFRAWLSSCMLEALEKTVPSDQTWSKEANSFVKASLQAEAMEPGAASGDSLSSLAQASAAKNCDDPLTRLWIGEALFRSGKTAAASPHLRKAAAKLQRWEYPKLALSMASDRLSAASDGPASQDLAKAAMNLAASSMAEAAVDAGAYAPPSPFAAFAGLKGLQSASSNPKLWRTALATASAISTYPKPLLDALKLKAALEEAKAAEAPEARRLAEEAFKTARSLAELNPGRPEFPELAIEALALCPDAASPAEAKSLLDKAAASPADCEDACLAYIDYLGAAMPGQPDKLLSFGRACLATGRFDTPLPRIYLAALLRIASDEAAFNWREAFLAPGVADDLETLYLGLIGALPPDAKAQRDLLAMERVLLLAWCGSYDAANALFSKVPAEAAILNAAFKGFRLPWKPQSIPELESELRAFTGVQKASFQQWDEAMRKADLENAVKLASKLIAGSASDKPLRQLLRVRTAWRLAGEPAGKIQPSEEADPLTFAIRTKRLDAAKFLLENGYELKRRGRESSLPLVLALSSGVPEDLIKLLVAKGADPDYKAPESGETPISMAIERKMPSAAEFMAEMGADVNTKLNDSGKSPLHLACASSMSTLARTLLKRGAKANVQDAKGDTPLHSAVAAGSADCVQALLSRGADPNAKNAEGLSPIDLAAKSGDERIVQMLNAQPPPPKSAK